MTGFGCSLSFTSIGQESDPLPALSPQSLFDERKVVNRNAGGGGALVEARDAAGAAGAAGTQSPREPPLPPLYFPPTTLASAAPRILGVEPSIALLVIASNVATLVICLLLIILTA